MLILGLTKTTLLDYPSKVAATIFTGGCNFRCPFCHNGPFVINAANEDPISKEEVMEHLVKRRNVLNGVCITGGEPTIQADLPDLIKEIKALGYDIKLDTNGGNPGVLKKLIDEGLIDYVAMDIKNSMEKYIFTAKINGSLLDKVKESVEILKAAPIPYEFRTTVVKPLHEREDFEKIAKWIEGAPNWYIQSYKESKNVISPGFASYTKEEITDMLTGLSEKYGLNISLRGIE